MAIPQREFESIVRKHQAMLYRIAFNFFRRSHLAEEVVQEVFLQLHEHRERIEPAEHLTAWLRRAATHRCIDVTRKRQPAMEVQVEKMPDVPDLIRESDPLLDERLRDLVATLPEKQRMVVILRYGEDLDSDEIGVLLDMPAPTVRSHLQRALVLLREKVSRVLGETDYEPTGKQTS